MQALRHYLLALQFFTRVPLSQSLARWVGWSPEMQRASMAHMPGVGWLVGLCAATALALVHWLTQASPWAAGLAAAISTASTLWMTGCFHEDGLADMADGLGGHVPPERALEIMKDSRLGSYGVMTVVMALLIKTLLIAMLLERLGPVTAAALLACTHALSRFAPLVLMRCLPHVGLAANSKTLQIAGQPPSRHGLITGAIWCLPALGLLYWCGLGWLLPVWAVAGALTSWRFQRWLRLRLGGITGDCLGACQQVHELALLLVAAVATAMAAAPLALWS